ncbi:MAG: DUF4296 domain-containing protein [Paludibacteraceae bacterium]|nr:DUF4296 domain-containing protein [Paludibacteraceae bacterium]
MKHTLYTILLIGCLLCLSLSSCNEDRPDYVPDNKEMASLLYDIHITEALVATNHVRGENQKAVLYKKNLQEHNMSNAEFDSCIIWFNNNKAEYKEVYNIIKSQLELEKNKILAGDYAYRIANKYNHVFNFYSPFFASKDSAISHLPEITLPPEFGRDKSGGYPYVERLGRGPIFKEFWN